MTVSEWAAAEELTVFSAGESDRAITGGYCGDLLSWVMGRAPADAAWMTVMGNVNAIAVAVLKDLACVVLCEGAAPDREALERAAEQGVWVLGTDRTAYDMAVSLRQAL